MSFLPDMELLKINITKTDVYSAKVVLEPLAPGYGVTLGNSLRRVMLSSLPGAAITAIRVNNIGHEFSQIDGVKEDMIELILNLKTLRLTLFNDEPTTIYIKKSSKGEIRAKDIEKNPNIKIIDPQHYIATLDKGGKLEIEALISKGIGYLPTELADKEKMPIGMIAIDATFTPVKKISYEVENTRVGQMTNYDKLIFNIMTDGTLDSDQAFYQGAQILLEHFTKITQTVAPKENKKTKKIAGNEKSVKLTKAKSAVKKNTKK